ncbi:MAG TPA: acyltransferase [Rhabdaerophilum sp.]|nr:acyltransferase [Rhabdaerophilum sp.]
MSESSMRLSDDHVTPALPTTYVSIQQLRALAALGVVLAHLEIYLGRMGFTGAWPHFLTSGVDIFFVISGFIMWVTTADRTVTPGQFLLNRLIRIAPLYWVVTSLALAVLLTNKGLMPGAALDWGHVFASFLFIPAVHPVLGEPQPLVTAGWTLNFEMMFYTLFALALFLPQRFRINAVLTLLLGVVSLRAFDPRPFGAIWFYSSNIILEFGFGVMIGALVTAGRRYSTRTGAILVVLGAILVVLLSEVREAEHLRAILRGVPSAMIVLGAVMLELDGRVLVSRFARFLGDASYSIYLTHGMVLSAFTRVWMKLLPPALSNSFPLFCFAGFVVAAVAGSAIYLWVEKPLGRIAKNLLSPRRKSVAA